jgi:hypothetical protein
MTDGVNHIDRLLGAIFASDAIVDALKEHDPVPLSLSAEMPSGSFQRHDGN